jgi:hypothetical protein
MVDIRHTATAPLPGSALIGSSEWNDAHTLTGTANTVLGFDGSGNPVALLRGRVLQVVYATSDTFVTNATTTYEDTTLTATITPSSTSSKVLVLVDQSIRVARGADNAYGGLRLLRDATVIYAPFEDPNGPYEYGLIVEGADSIDIYTRAHFSLLDSPLTTSATTYKTQFRPYQTTLFGSMAVQESLESRITLLEIAG